MILDEEDLRLKCGNSNPDDKSRSDDEINNETILHK
jgi:hypothetical protein